MMNVSHLQSVIRRNSTTIQELEVKLQAIKLSDQNSTDQMTTSSPFRRKVVKLAALQVTLKKEIADMLVYNRLYGEFA